jgi:hypothetical protein
VSNRVLQHIVDEAEFTKVLRHLASLTRYFYVNEAGMEASWHNPHLKGRDYIEIFRGLGWRVAEQGELTAEDGTRQRWMLFADYQKIDKAMPFEIGIASGASLGSRSAGRVLGEFDPAAPTKRAYRRDIGRRR